MISIEELTVEIARQRDVLKRIEALVWYEPDDEDDLVEAVRAMACERDEARRDLGAILAVIHRDGGHHTGEHGLSQSVADAHATWASVVRERDEARAQVKAWQSEELSRRTERDAARAEVERLRARVRSVDRSTAYEGKAFSDNESSQEDLAVVASERDEARSERERLRRERDYALAEVSRRDREHGALVETAQKALAHVAAERDEARAEVERLRSALAQAQRADE